jgi:signal transduction histidine kinase
VTGVDRPDHPWLLPASLAATTGHRPARRTARDWAVDSALFVLALIYALITMEDMRQADSWLGVGNAGPPWLLDVDVAAGLLACGALWLRRRWPVGLAVALLPVGMFSVTSGVAQLVVFMTVAIHRRFAVAAAVAGAGLAGSVVFNIVRPDQQLNLLGATVWSAVVIGLVQLGGMFVRARRQLVLSLRDRAERAETEQQLRIAQARHLERTRIAREMHDVLAHRISLLSLHAGALEFRPDAPAADIARAAGVVRGNAHAALADLRAVIGVLREDGGPAGPSRPQPTWADVPALVAESREAGVPVDLRDEVGDPRAVPDTVGRTAYRLVQEGLTNARKHAGGARITVHCAGSPGDGLAVEVSNPRPVGMATAGSPPDVRIPGTGTGLVGLTERITLAGGRLEYGATPTGGFRLAARLPWPAGEGSDG